MTLLLVLVVLAFASARTTLALELTTSPTTTFSCTDREDSWAIDGKTRFWCSWVLDKEELGPTEVKEDKCALNKELYDDCPIACGNANCPNKETKTNVNDDRAVTIFKDGNEEVLPNKNGFLSPVDMKIQRRLSTVTGTVWNGGYNGSLQDKASAAAFSEENGGLSDEGTIFAVYCSGDYCDNKWCVQYFGVWKF